MFSIVDTFFLAMAFQSAYGQFFGGGGGFGFGGGFNGFGCGAFVPTVGNECLQPETGKGTVVCVCKCISMIIDLRSSYKLHHIISSIKLKVISVSLSFSLRYWLLCIYQCWLLW